MPGDVIRFTSPHDGAITDYEVVALAEEDSVLWKRPMVRIRGCQGEPHLGLIFGRRSDYTDCWSVVAKENR